MHQNMFKSNQFFQDSRLGEEVHIICSDRRFKHVLTDWVFKKVVLYITANLKQIIKKSNDFDIHYRRNQSTNFVYYKTITICK